MHLLTPAVAENLTPLTNPSPHFSSYSLLWCILQMHLFLFCFLLSFICIFPILPPSVIAFFLFLLLSSSNSLNFFSILMTIFFSNKILNPYLHDNRCFTRQLSLICHLCISHEPMSLYTALCSTLLLRLFQDPDNVCRIFNQVYSGSKTLHISTCLNI